MMKLIRNSGRTRKILYSLFTLIFLLITIYPLPQALCEYRKVKPEWVMPDNYPEWFHGWGRIGYFEDNELVINDMDYRVSPRATFHTPDDDYASRYIFTPGQTVGFLLNENGEIISVWLITKDL